MSLFKGALSLRRYRVMQKPPEGWREGYAKSLAAHALVPIDSEGREVQSIGWCSVYDPQQLDFGVEHVEGRLLLSLRVDALKPDAGEVKKRVKQRARELEAERSAPLTKAALRELKELVVLDLRKTTPVKTRTVEAIWDLDAQRLYVLSHSKKGNEQLVGLFAQTFSIALDLEGPGFWAEKPCFDDGFKQVTLGTCKPTPELLGGFRGLRPCLSGAVAEVPEQDDATPDAVLPEDVAGLTDRRFLGREFLTWLVMKAEGDGTTFESEDDDFKVQLGSRVLCKALGEGAAEIAARGDDPLEVRYAIAGGLTVRELDVFFSAGDRAWSLAVSAENFDLKRVKLPVLLSEDDSERAHERLELLDQADAMLECAYGHFLSVRLSAEWVNAVAEMRLWLEDSIRAD